MYIPQTFKDSIKSTFYDKEVEVLENKTSMDDEGGVNYKGLEKVNSFFANVSFSNCKKIQEEYGLNYDINISITTDYKDLKINNLIKYEDKIYNITDKLKSDSHILYVGILWQQ